MRNRELKSSRTSIGTLSAGLLDPTGRARRRCKPEARGKGVWQTPSGSTRPHGQWSQRNAPRVPPFGRSMEHAPEGN